jgi:DNA-binding NarL/FixJ family response regulator
LLQGEINERKKVEEELRLSRDQLRALAARLLKVREEEILRLLASGMTMGQIADTLAVSPKTVSTYRSRLLIKLALRTNAELIRYAVNNNLAD